MTEVARVRPAALPLCWRPGRVALLDDDPVFLQLAGAPLERRWSTALYSDAAEFVEALRREVPFWEADAWHQQEVVRAWRSKESSLAAEVIRYWARNTERFALTRVALVDHALGGSTGLDALRSVQDWRGHAVLLTGEADHRVAIAAFNERLIDRYESKSDGPLFPRLSNLVAELQHAADQRLDQIWRTTIVPAQDAILRQPDVARELGAYLRQRVAEYVVLGEPFGILGLTAHGRVVWLPLRISDADATEWFDDGDLRASLRLGKFPTMHTPAVRFGHARRLCGGYFLLDQGAVSAEPSGYGSWLELHKGHTTNRYKSGG